MQELEGSGVMTEALNERDGHLLLSPEPKGSRSVSAGLSGDSERGVIETMGNSLFFLHHSLQAQ